MISRVLLCAACVLTAGAARASDQLQYGPAPGWVVPLPIPKASPNTDVAAELLLQDTQSRFGPDQDEYYTESVILVRSAQALAAAGNLSLVWSPDTESVTVHRLHIIRDGRVIDVLAGGKKFTILRREQNLELSSLDGALTATIQPEDLRVGDVIDLAMTKQRHDPVYQGRSEGGAAMARPGVVGHAHFRALWPAAKPMRWSATDDLGKGVLVRKDGQNELTFDLTNAEAPKPPKDAPLRFARLGQMEITQFRDWAEVSALMAPLYQKARALGPASPLRREIERIKAASADPRIRTEMALRLVEDQVRYVALLMNLGGYNPAEADTTWARRYGDCKAKTALLLALLDGLGVEAQPALVNSSAGDELSELLPALSVFDHVIVRARIGGKVYWLDGTRLGDRHLDDVPIPEFRWALPVQASGAVLEKLEPPPFDQPETDVLVHLDASKGLDAPAPAHLEYVYRGDVAVVMHLGFAALNKADAERANRDIWTKQYPWITATSVGSSYDDDHRVLRLTMDGSAKMDWTQGAQRWFQIDESSLGYDASFRREPGPHLDAPYSVEHPSYQRWFVSVVLPRRNGFTIGNAPDVDRVIAGIAYHRVSRIKDGVATMEASTRSLQPEFPASEAEADAAALRDLARTDVLISYIPPVVDQPLASTVDEPAPPPPTDAAGFSQRGVTFLVRRDYAKAIADLSQAIKLDPKASSHFYNRGLAYLQSDRPELAIADFDAALSLKPGDPLALLARGRALLERGEEAKARADFDAALKPDPNDYRMLLRRAEAYRQAGRADQAVAYFTEIVARLPGPDHGAAVSGLCRARADQGKDPAQAISDCDAALKLSRGDVGALIARGTARMKLGKLDQALADFDEAVADDPKNNDARCALQAAQRAKGLPPSPTADGALPAPVCGKPARTAVVSR